MILLFRRSTIGGNNIPGLQFNLKFNKSFAIFFYESDVVFGAHCSSKKFFADGNPLLIGHNSRGLNCIEKN
jgi:hypothetical protein